MYYAIKEEKHSVWRLRNFLRLWILKKLTVYFEVDVTFVASKICGCLHHTSVHKLVFCSDLVYYQGSWIFKSKVPVLVESVYNFAL